MTDAAAIDAIEVTLSSGSRFGLTLGLAVMIFSVALTLKPEDFAYASDSNPEIMDARALQGLVEQRLKSLQA